MDDSTIIKEFIEAIDKFMQDTGWEYVGNDELDDAVACWMHKDYDPRDPHKYLTDLAIMGVQIENGRIAEIDLLATGEGYQPYDTETYTNPTPVDCADWFRLRLDAYGQLPKGA